MSELARAVLADVIAAVEEGGRMLAAEFSTPAGPRGGEHKAPIDKEIELMLRPRLLALIPGRFIGEEDGIVEAPGAEYVWAVDPQDGTKAFGEGRRGSAVSVGLLRHGVPVMGVVFAPTSPDRGPDMIAWAEGQTAILRNGEEVRHDLTDMELAPETIVLLNHTSGLRPLTASGRVAPARYVPMPSIAYRLARIAVGDSVGTMSLNTITTLDYAAGHALLRAVGGVLTDGAGRPITYTDAGDSEAVGCFGGAPRVVAALSQRSWRGSSEPRRDWRVTLSWPRAVEDRALDRALGAMLGLLIGDGDDTGQPDSAGEAAITVARALLAGETAPDGGASGSVPRGILGDVSNPLAAAVSAGIGGADLGTVREIAGDPRDPALAAALLGAATGRRAFTAGQTLAVMACRPDVGLGVARPRPDMLWPDDVIDIAESLLLRRKPC
jgi:fructose-1,6-bisphosphatase/inositol monophosphatase family enzyme